MILKCVTLLYFFCEAEQLPKLRFKLFYSNTEKSSGGARSASNFYLIKRKFCGGARSASNFFNRKVILRRSSLRFMLLFNRKVILRRSSLRFNFYLTESNSAAEFAPLHTFIRPINISTEKMLRFDNCPLLFLRISGKMIITNIFEPHSKGAAAFR